MAIVFFLVYSLVWPYGVLAIINFYWYIFLIFSIQTPQLIAPGDPVYSCLIFELHICILHIGISVFDMNMSDIYRIFVFYMMWFICLIWVFGCRYGSLFGSLDSFCSLFLLWSSVCRGRGCIVQNWMYFGQGNLFPYSWLLALSKFSCIIFGFCIP